MSQIGKVEPNDAKEFEIIKQNIENMDEKAYSKEVMIKNVDLSMEEHLKEKTMLDKYYIESIKQKMKLLDWWLILSYHKYYV